LQSIGKLNCSYDRYNIHSSHKDECHAIETVCEKYANLSGPYSAFLLQDKMVMPHLCHWYSNIFFLQSLCNTHIQHITKETPSSYNYS